MRTYWERAPLSLPAEVTLWIMLAILVAVLVWSRVEWARAMEEVEAMWNCPVSQWVPVRDPGQPWWTPDWGTTWLEVER